MFNKDGIRLIAQSIASDLLSKDMLVFAAS